MSLFRVVLRLARNPGTAYAEGDDHRGYALVLPLTPEGAIDEAAFRADEKAAVVRRFAPDEDPEEGRLARRADVWTLDYGEDGGAPEFVHRLGEHRFVVGEYVSVTNPEGEVLTYKVTEADPL
jgi:hypothetical protein